MPRIPDVDRLTGERLVLDKHIAERANVNTEISMITGKENYLNPVKQSILGAFRRPTSRKAAIADMDTIQAFQRQGVELPSFMEAGPRQYLRHPLLTTRAAIVTCGGLAPGIHCVIHGIVKRHCDTYAIGQAGAIFGVYNSYRGLCSFADNHRPLSPRETELWLEQGGSNLGGVRYEHKPELEDKEQQLEDLVQTISRRLTDNNIDILYVIGGDGSLKVAEKLANVNSQRSIVGIPKTMDNDILWVWQSFGFDTAVEQATRVVNTLHAEAYSTRRICLVELFGAESGFVAANATLGSGHVDLVLIPEVFKALDSEAAVRYLEETVNHVRRRVQERPHEPHAMVVVAEGVATVLEKKEVTLGGIPVKKGEFLNQLEAFFAGRVTDAHGTPMQVLKNEPRHIIRAVPANAHDQIYCERLGALAVDNALAGYSNFMISNWLTEFVLVPLRMVGSGKKSIPISGMFWRQVVASTGQPLSSPELAVDTATLPESEE